MNRVTKALHDRGLSQRECARHSPPIETDKDWPWYEKIAVFVMIVFLLASILYRGPW